MFRYALFVELFPVFINRNKNDDGRRYQGKYNHEIDSLTVSEHQVAKQAPQEGEANYLAV